jgi:hypothetical protein
MESPFYQLVKLFTSALICPLGNARLGRVPAADDASRTR